MLRTQHLTGQAIILRIIKFRDYDLILHLFSPEIGRVSALARGARRTKKATPGDLSLFNIIEGTFLAKGRGSILPLTHRKLVRRHSLIETDIAKFAAGSNWAELLLALVPEGQEEHDLFHLVLSMYALLNDAQPESLSTLCRLFEAMLLQKLGYLPELSRCPKCETPYATVRFVHLDAMEHGLFCQACMRQGPNNTSITYEALECLSSGLRLMAGADVGHFMEFCQSSVVKEQLRQLKAMIRYFLHHTIQSKPQTEKFLDECGL